MTAAADVDPIGDLRLLIVGVGNPTRSDDALGPMVVQALASDPRASGIEATTVSGDLSNLILSWTGEVHVVVVDAVVSGRAPGTVVELSGSAAGMPVGFDDEVPRLTSSHGFGLAETLLLADRLGRLPGRLTVIGVEAGRFDLMGEPTAEVATAVPEVVDRIVALSVTPAR